MAELSWQATKQLVYERAGGCYEYCQTCADNIGQAMHIEHIIPDGNDDPYNLCLSCANCNLSKSVAVYGIDPVSGEETPLFHLRQQTWADHFRWIENGLQLEGLTSIGRATIERLRMNQERILIARRRWISGGFHPPK